MRILDKDNNEITSPDLEKGYLKIETIVTIHHEAVEATPGKSHIEVVKEYDNGGKDVVEVWDEKPTEAKDAYDETEEIQRYIPYSADELEKIAKEEEETENKEAKINSLYNADMTFSDVVDAVAGLLYGGAE
jgi:hypothetical protein